MECGHELHLPEHKSVRSANVHRVGLGAVVDAELRQFVGGDDHGAIALGEGNGVAQMIAVPVRQEHGIDPGHAVDRDVGRGIAGQERIDDYAATGRVEDEAGVAVEGDGEHASSVGLERPAGRA